MTRPLIHTLFFTFALALPLQNASAKDYVGTYTLEGQDSQGEKVQGSLQIHPDGRLERQVQANSKSYSTAGVATITELAPGSVEFTLTLSAQAPKVGMSGLLDGVRRSRVQPASPERLHVTWSSAQPGAVRVEYEKGAYASSEQGSRAARRYDLRLLRDHPGPSSEITYRVKVENRGSNAPGHSEQLKYLRRGDLSQETRTYEQLNVNGQEKLRRGVEQNLTRRGTNWHPEPGRSTRNLAGSGSVLVPSTYRPLKITDMLPREPVAVGAEWPLPLELMVPALNLPSKPIAGTVRGRLMAVEPVEGGVEYRVALLISLQLGPPQAGSLRGRIRVRQGPLYHHVESSMGFSSDSVEQRIDSRYSVEDKP